MYQHGRKARRQRNPRVYLQAAALLGVALIAVAWILHKDLSTGSDEKSTVPIVTEVLGDVDDTITINEPLFTMELPTDWKQTNRVQTKVANYYEWRSTKQGAADRMLRLHIDTMPKSYKVVRLQPLHVDGRGFRLGNLSNDCVHFAKDTDAVHRTQGNAPVEAKWENITFMCDQIKNNQTIGTGTETGGIAAEVSSSTGKQHRYFFFWQDHNIRPDDRMFRNILDSFKAR